MSNPSVTDAHRGEVSADDTPSAETAAGDARHEAVVLDPMPTRAMTVLKVKKLWIFPVIVPLILVSLMSFIYVGSVVNPTAHLHGLPVMVVNQDRGTTLNGQRLNEGDTVVHALTTSPKMSTRLHLEVVTITQAEAAMDRGAAYSAVVIPADFTASLLAAAGEGGPGQGEPIVHLLENVRLGSLGVNLAVHVLTPGFEQISSKIGAQLVAHSTAAARGTAFSTTQLENPVHLETTDYRPLPANSALGLSAFYVSLLAMMAGFVGATIVNSSLDSALGYATSELGPRWKQRRPVPISRKQTLLLKWSVAMVVVPLLDAAIIGVAVGVLRMDAPHTFELWAVLTLASLMVASATLTLFALFGSIGQLLAMLGLVYLSLASSGGTIPTQALPGFYNFVGQVEPLRQVLTAARAVLYFGAQSDAGLSHAVVVLAAEVVVAIVIGLTVTSWYDHRRLYRMPPALISYVNTVTDGRLASVPPSSSPASSSLA